MPQTGGRRHDSGKCRRLIAKGIVGHAKSIAERGVDDVALSNTLRNLQLGQASFRLSQTPRVSSIRGGNFAPLKYSS